LGRKVTSDVLESNCFSSLTSNIECLISGYITDGKINTEVSVGFTIVCQVNLYIFVFTLDNLGGCAIVGNIQASEVGFRLCEHIEGACHVGTLLAVFDGDIVAVCIKTSGDILEGDRLSFTRVKIVGVR